MSTERKPAVREKLSEERPSLDRRFSIPYIEHDHETKKDVVKQLKVYVIVGMHWDGRAAELFIRTDKSGETLSGALDAMAVAVSLGLQYGVPLQAITAKYRHMRFPPSGFMPWDDDFKSCDSVVDLIAQWLDVRFPNGKLGTKEVLDAVIPQQSKAG